MTLIPIESGNRIQLPVEWTEALGLHGVVVLERTGDGILVRPCPGPRLTWDPNEDELELNGDDFLF